MEREMERGQGPKVVTKWFMRFGLLSQFSQATE